tara:strand:+ start:6322 stop:7656 length:1335 start_codon:yes stop_codon:yes gene_type:complete
MNINLKENNTKSSFSNNKQFGQKNERGDYIKRMLRLFLLPVCLCIIFLTGCKNDDTMIPAVETQDPDEDVNSLPSEFIVGVEVHNFYSATVAWEEATSTLPNPIDYDIYLNDALIVDSLTERVYELDALEELSNYTVKIIAKNEIGETPVLTEFSTPEKKELRLVKIVTEFSNSQFVNNFDYNQEGEIVKSETVVDWNDPTRPDWDFTRYSFTYLDGQLTSESASFPWDAGISLGTSSSYTYDDDQLLELRLSENYDGYETRRTHTFTSSTSYNFIRERFDFIGIYETRNREVDIVFNGNGELIEYHQNNIEEGTMDTIIFQYESGNLIKVTNGSNVFEVRYDTANNFLTYSNNGLSPHYNCDCFQTSGFFKANTTTWPFLTMRRIPHFLTYKNQNNPTEYKLNGVIFQYFQYEYNPHGYPSKISYPNSGGTITEEVLTYEDID